MTRSKALLLGGITLWPVIYMILFMVLIFSQIFMVFTGGTPPSPGEMPTIIKIIFPLHFFTMFWIMVLLGIYIWHLFKTDAVPQDKKTLWAVIIFLGNMVSMPVYWYLYIWKNVESKSAEPRSSQ